MLSFEDDEDENNDIELDKDKVDALLEDEDYLFPKTVQTDSKPYKQKTEDIKNLQHVEDVLDLGFDDNDFKVEGRLCYILNLL